MTARPAARRRRRGESILRRHTHGLLDAEALEDLDPDDEVDARGTFCPEPVIRTQNAMADMEPGRVLLLLADDAGAEVDIPAWCISTRNDFLGILKEETVYRIFVRRAG